MIEKKVVVLGSGGVGKSAFTVQYVQNVFVEKYDPTIEDSYRKSVEIEGKQYMLEILDTAGTEQFESMRDLYLKNGNGFILIFDITNTETFKATNDIYEKIVDVKENKPFPCVFVGNKCDLEDQREVRKEDVLRYINTLGHYVEYLEGSAKKIINVDKAFEDLIKINEKIENVPKKKKSGGCCVL